MQGVVEEENLKTRVLESLMQAAASADLTSRASHDNLLVVFGGLLLVMLLAALDSTIVATALPTIVGEFGGLAHISWVVTAIRGAYIEAFVASLNTVFLLAAAISFFGLLVALLLPERPLRETIAAAAESDIGGEIAQTFAMPTDTGSREQLLRGLAVLADRDVRRRYIAAIVARAGVELSPAEAWLLVQIEREPGVGVNELGRKGKVSAEKLKAATAELFEKSLIAGGSGAEVYQLTESGCEMYNRLATARREHLAELWPEWSPKKREEVAEILRRLARELIPEAETART